MKILHTADSHLDYKQYGFSERLEDFMLALAYIFHQAQALKVDAILLAGDQFQGVHPSGQAVYFLHKMVQQARAAGIQVLGIDGNHDAVANMWLQVCGIEPLDLGAPERFYRTDSVNQRQPRWVPGDMTTVANAANLNIIGINSCPSAVFRDKLKAIAAAFTAANRKLDILVIHQALAELCGFEGADLTAAEIVTALEPLGTRLVLMGDIHDYNEAVFGNIRFIYPGSPEVTEMGEQPNKTFSVIDIDVDNVRTAIYPIPTRPIFDCYITTQEEFDQLLAKAAELKTADGRMPMTIVGYDPDKMPDFRRRAQEVLNGKMIYRIIPRPAGEAKADIFAQLSQKTFERHGAMNNMRSVLAQSYPPDTDEYALIIQCMEQPDNLPVIVQQFAKSKGIEIKI